MRLRRNDELFRLPDAARPYVAMALLFALMMATAPATSATVRPALAVAHSQTPQAKPTPVVVPRLPRQEKPSAPDDAKPAIDAPSQETAPAPPMPPAPDAIDEDEVVRVTSNLVVVPVSVTDANGEAVQNLKIEDFRLEEEGRSQSLAAVGDADQVPLDIALVFDVSSSVTKNFEFEKEAAAGFLKQVMKPIDRAAIFAIKEKPSAVQTLAASGVAAAKLTTLEAAQKATGTAFYDTVSAAARYLAEHAPERHRRVILVISDGEDNFSDDVREATIAEVGGGGNLLTAREKTKGLHGKALQKVLREVQRADAVFYSINPSGPGLRLNVISQRAQDGMRLLADTTGGSAFVPDRIENLDGVFRQIAAELRAQYLIQYLSNNQAQPGKFLRIKVTTPARPGLRIRARQGYYKKG